MAGGGKARRGLAGRGEDGEAAVEGGVGGAAMAPRWPARAAASPGGERRDGTGRSKGPTTGKRRRGAALAAGPGRAARGLSRPAR